jgi:hypothetical protein
MARLVLWSNFRGFWTRQCQAMFTDPCTDLPYIDEMIVILTVEFHLLWQAILPDSTEQCRDYVHKQNLRLLHIVVLSNIWDK